MNNLHKIILFRNQFYMDTTNNAQRMYENIEQEAWICLDLGFKITTIFSLFSLSHLQNYHNHNSQQYVPNCERPEAEDQDLLEMLPSVAHPYGDILEVRVLECLEVSVLRAKLNLAKLNLK